MADEINIAELFHENTNILPAQVGLEDAPLPEPRNEFARIRLPQVEMVNTCGLEEAIVRRHSQRDFVRKASLSPRVLSWLLRFACSYVERADSDSESRT